MTFVSTSRFTSNSAALPYSVSVGAGDVLVGVLSAGRLSVSSGSASLDRLTADGWTKAGLWSSIPTGVPSRLEGVGAVLWRRAASAGTVSGSLVWGGSVESNVFYAGLTFNVMRFSGMGGVKGFAATTAGDFYPAVNVAQPSPTGHAIRLALTPLMPTAYWDEDDSAPVSGHSKRLDECIGNDYRYSNAYKAWAAAWTQSLSSSALPAAVEKATSRYTGVLVTAYLASTNGPAAPAITSPDGAVRDLAAAWTLAWTPDGEQTGVRVTRQSLDGSGAPTGSVEYLTSVGTPAWSTSATTVTTTATTVAVPAGQFSAAGARYRLTVATVGDSSAPDLGDPASLDVTSWQAPVASNPNVGASLVGGVIVNRAPWIQVDGTPGSGATIDLHEVQVVDSTTGEVYAQGTYSGNPPNTWWHEVPATEEGALPNGVTVTLRGRVRQLGTQWSEWVEAGPYLVDAPRPAAPTLTVAQATHLASGLPGLAVTVTSSVAGTVTLYRDGVSLGSFATAAGALEIHDYNAPTDVTVTYTATTTNTAALPETSQPSTAATAVLSTADRRQWLIDPLDPATAQRVHLIDVGSVEHGTRSMAYQPINSPSWIVRSMGRVDPSGSLTLLTVSRSNTDAVLSLLTSSRRLVLRAPTEEAGGVKWPHGLTPFRVTSPVSEDRVVQRPYAYRHISFEWVSDSTDPATIPAVIAPGIIVIDNSDSVSISDDYVLTIDED